MALVRLYEGIKLMHHSVYTFYRQHKKIPKTRKVKGREDLRKVLDCICKHIGEGITETPGGVHIDRLGYFFVWKVPRKSSFFQIRKDGQEECFNFHTDHHMFFPTFIPTKPKVRVLQAWTMDKAFANKINKRVSEKLRQGFKYRMYAHSLQQI